MYRLTKFTLLAAVLLSSVSAVPAQQRSYQGSYQSVRQLIIRIESRTNVFRSNLSYAFERRRVYDSSQQQELNRLASDFGDAVSQLRTRFDRRQARTADVQGVLNLALQIDSQLIQQRVNARTQSDWASLRTDLQELARTFRLSWSADNSSYPTQRPYWSNQLTGTYRLDVSRSDNTADIAERATRSLPSWNRDRMRDQLMARLESPDQIAIERRGRTITIASSRASQITFEADGSQRVETNPDGRSIRATATLAGDQLVVTSTGDRANEFSVTFNPIDNGRRLSITRRVYSNGLTSPVVVQSLYDKSSEVARFDLYDGTQPYPSGSNPEFIVRDGETVIAELEQPLSTETAREGERFTMIVRQPSTIQGATIEGQVTNVERSGRLTGRSQMTLNFDTIRLRNGRSYRFAGVLESVRLPGGDVIQVDNEGAVKDDSQTAKTTQRAAIGTAVGAIIGAIAGGGKGAAIGAVIGAGGGAGSVYVQGRDDLELDRGSEVTIRASGPRY